ncbi:MAG: zinc metallopeptidase [Bacteroidales bacterium]|jgi:Zn-dependent membrane protease YugP|nr:zinc metallopeptidase [Bacteroidales bacterium]HOA08776.1 zinc metallopeptidase [Tenuifilaceae bacterium]MBP8642534.1 zinc metallopeptidase [Bacteroidales bacterium]HOC36253.1 zinc metallopeptidase [Tenuifilaceae bacterium]HOG71281.1 zinc metallopeptidase [Tenuifilaceae bacterium]
MGIYLIMIIFFVLSFLISNQLKVRFARYSKIDLPQGMTGKEVAEMMLKQHGIFDVRVISTTGQLTDHYNPTDRTINLSPAVYNGHNIAAAAVAAHECGHAVQHAQSYAFLQLRSSLVPVVSVASRWVQWILLAGVILLQSMPAILVVGVALLALTTLFSLITLPVEFDASRRALQWLGSTGILYGQNVAYARDALKWAALTYVIAALGSLATLFYYLGFLNNND